MYPEIMFDIFCTFLITIEIHLVWGVLKDLYAWSNRMFDIMV